MHTPGDLVQLESVYLLERWPQDPVNVDFTKQVHLVELASACLQASYSSLLEFQSKYILGLVSACANYKSLWLFAFTCWWSWVYGSNTTLEHLLITKCMRIGLTTEFPIPIIILNPVAGLEIQKGGFSHWRAKRVRKFWGCHAHFRSRWKSELNISKQL